MGDHRTARQYLSWYLEARPSAAPAHKLLGHVLAASGEPAEALVQYGRSLELDCHQKDLVMDGEMPPGDWGVCWPATVVAPLSPNHHHHHLFAGLKCNFSM